MQCCSKKNKVKEQHWLPVGRTEDKRVITSIFSSFILVFISKTLKYNCINHIAMLKKYIFNYAERN